MTVCVDYSQLLSQSIETWLREIEKLVVVTVPRDTYTINMCDHLGVMCYQTDCFYADGAHFNKGRAMAEAFDACLDPVADWMLFFDADITPPPRWRDSLRDCIPGNLYGARRRLQNGTAVRDPDIAGYFHLAHASDPNMGVRPIVDTCWTHAGNYDTTFQDRWPRERRKFLHMTLTHVGIPGKNWCGVNNGIAMQYLHAERLRRRGWRHETINTDGVPLDPPVPETGG